MKNHLTPKEKIEYKYLIELISSSLNGTEPLVPNDEISWGRIAKLAEYCSCEALVANAVMKLGTERVGIEVYANFKRIASVQLLIDGNISYETERILAAFDEFKVKNCPLKGYFMKREYPRPDFRSVSDVDILFDRSQIVNVRKAFAGIGYSYVTEDDAQYHFRKSPFPYVEMHADLVHANDRSYPFLKDQLDRTVKREKYKYSYKMTLEDYYIFMLVHSAKHYLLGGMGLRMVLDVYVFYKNHKDELDSNYLNKRLEKMNLSLYERRIREIAFNWFSGKTAVMTFNDVEEYILLSGTLGRLDVAVMVGSQTAAENQGKGKISYLLSTLFPPLKAQKYHYKYLRKVPVLLPISWVQMWGKRIFIQKNVHVKQGFKNRLAYTDEDVTDYKSLLHEMGFEKVGLQTVD